ncbi:MAG: DNA polymerase III subunit gamma/tau [Candidatus Omnitrophica bacterium]|nr:DNA polymerase III subunit gamma/tau [Candidatus Omnitrophota bacterium]MCF7879057.1 DNA polymerase III subunit gamma/tau [Candidatus Omnitrophota bacterium]MCF7893251.1 DNA polymerase III subunit gamma/tau [Candidatus Omnitrophota bacterium]
MSYLAFALKYRPQDFSQVVGQEHVVSSLSEAILKRRIHHAYLFSGPRGIGKTSLARILAKSLNCQKGPTPEPCLSCPSCIDIAAGKSLDIIEIDGASNRGIDEIRSLRENVKLSPAAGRFKVYIIDEVHMLTKEAFNALLKTLEEPPKHVKFIFATTDPHKVLPTILSRCQKFQFNLLSLNQIVAKLKDIAKKEKIKIDEALFYTIAQAAEGSIRDAESLLDQVFPVISTGKDIKDIFSFLGIVDENALAKIINFLSDGNLSDLLAFIDTINKEGKDLGVFQDYFLKYLRNFLLAKIDLDRFQQLAEISPQSKSFITKTVPQFSLARILELIDLLIQAKDSSKQINSARIPFELALIKFVYKEKNPVKKTKASLANQKEKEPAKNPKEAETKEEPNPSGQKNNQQKSDLKKEKPKEQESSLEDDVLVQAVNLKWKEIISAMQAKRMAVASHLSFGQPTASSGKQIFISFSSRDKFHKEALDDEKNRKFIEDNIEQVINKKARVKFRIKDSDQEDYPEVKGDDSAKEEKAGPKAKRIEDGFLNDLLDTFDGKFHNND